MLKLISYFIVQCFVLLEACTYGHMIFNVIFIISWMSYRDNGKYAFVTEYYEIVAIQNHSTFDLS